MIDRVTVLGVEVVVSTEMPIPTATVWEGWGSSPSLDIETEVTIIDGIPPSWTLTNSGVALRLPTREFDETDIIYSSTLFAAERARQKAGYFLVHGSCVASENGAIIFLGDSGAGKTSVAVALALANGYKFISGDLTPLVLRNGRICAFGHWDRVRLRPSSATDIVSSSRERSLNLPQELRDWLAASSIGDWDNKLLVSPESLGLQVLLGHSPIILIIDLRVLPFASLSVQPIEPWRVRVSLNHLLSSFVYGFWAIVDNGGDLRSRPFFSNERSMMRNRLALASAAGEIPAIRLRGRFEQVVGWIHEWSLKSKHTYPTVPNNQILG